MPLVKRSTNHKFAREVKSLRLRLHGLREETVMMWEEPSSEGFLLSKVVEAIRLAETALYDLERKHSS